MVEIDLFREQLSFVREILDQGGSVHLRVSGHSMHPFFKEGDVLEIISVETQKLRLGDVILYDPGQGPLLVHRLVQIAKQNGEYRLLLQGDAVLNPDGWIRPTQVIALVIARVRLKQVKRLDSRWGKWMGYGLARFLPEIKTMYVRVSSKS